MPIIEALAQASIMGTGDLVQLFHAWLAAAAETIPEDTVGVLTFDGIDRFAGDADGASGKAHERRLLCSSRDGRNHEDVIEVLPRLTVQFLRKKPGDSFETRPRNWLSLSTTMHRSLPASSEAGMVPPRLLCWAAKTWSAVRLVPQTSGIEPWSWLSWR